MQIHLRCFGPSNNFIEIKKLSKNVSYNNIKANFTNFIIGLRNHNKTKAFLYFPARNPFVITFDFENWFSSPIDLINKNNIIQEYY